MNILSFTTAFAVIIPTLLSPSTFAETEKKKERENVLVTASRIEQPINKIGSSVSVLTSTEIEKLGFNNVADVLRTLPGIGVSRNGGSGATTALRIRGEESFRAKIIIDGVDVSDPTNLQGGPQVQHILSSQIERIEVLRGPQGVAYGGDAGGVINIITKKPEGILQGGLNLEYGRFDERNVAGNIRGIQGAFDYSLSASAIENNGFNARPSDTSQDDDGYENQTFNFSGGWAVTDSFQLRLNLRNVSSENEFDGCFNSSFVRSNDCVFDFDQTNYKLSAIFKTDNLSHDISVSRTDIERETFREGITNFFTEGTTDRAEYSGKADLTEASSLVYGAEYREEEITPDSGSEVDRNQKSIYIEWHSSITDRFNYILGARHDDNEDFGSHTSYRATGNYLALRNEQGDLSLKTSASTGFRAPSLFEVSFNNSSQATAPALGTTPTEETSQGFDIGAEFRTQNNNVVEITFFYQEIEDELFFDFDPMTFINIGYLQSENTSRSRGVELSGTYHISQNLTFRGNYTYNDATTRDRERRLRRPRNIVNASLDYAFANNRGHANLNYRFSDDVIDRGNVELDEYDLVSINLSYDVTHSVEIYGRVENVFDSEYVEINDFNTAGSSAYVGTRIRF